MQAAILYGREDLRVEERTLCALAKNEVRVRIESALTCGTDLKVFKRGYHAKMIRPPAPFGHELAGVIIEVGSEVSGWREGDKVVAANSAPCGTCPFCLRGQENLCDDLLFLNGAYAQSIVLPARIVEKNLLRLKSQTPFRDGALVEPLACVVQGLNDLRLRTEDRVLIIGAGPIGLMFLALAIQAGARVWVAGRGEKRLQQARKLGAVEVMDVSVKQDLLKAARDAQWPEFDAVIEAVGKPETWEAAVELAGKGGRINFFGGCPSCDDGSPFGLIQERQRWGWENATFSCLDDGNFRELPPGKSISFPMNEQSEDRPWRLGIRLFTTNTPKTASEAYHRIWWREIPSRSDN